MFRMKTLGALAAAGALVVGLTACSSGSDSPEGEGDGGSGGGDEGGLITIIVNDPANPYWKTEGDLAQAKAEELGYEAVVGSHEATPTPRTR